jgi:hypothetical protein
LPPRCTGQSRPQGEPASRLLDQAEAALLFSPDPPINRLVVRVSE